ncbi:adenine-specific DNA-methyltransferase [Sphingobacterium allocomposti]|uniref:site-specific DNA-methyltransferase (adenine-specific) n=1 Tax=Sphingobacterium allocomposti TaxID=415956 RepID=A0A5S5D9F9_9SPHI|nr:site-specific DNA-methyltransferase [Sphingobacterium composti Yoo et al. 2007 non Ten et al. 2007]TYP91362.1 adenine-specific DNA-methyltransferase [Sphingobacterium composti Yoo et al. 2007 non Ten et al. 2007]
MSEIQKQELTSMNIAEEQLRKLKELFPEAFTEGLKVDWDKLRLTLGQSIDVGKERYGMNWPGKADCFKIIQQPSIATLIPARDESVDFDTTENLFIEGDNLEVLKLLQKSYLGKIKLIYIDPPYNTGKEFIYPDNYSETLETYLEYTGQIDSEGRKFGTNTDTDGRFHSKWLNMMYPRLFLAKNLLSDDGIIFISIDDNEIHNLRSVCNEVFGEENFVSQISRATGTPTGGGNKAIVNEVDYILVYSKDNIYKSIEGLPLNDKEAAIYNLEDEGGKYLTRSLRRTGGEDRREDRPSMFYAIKSPDNEDVFPYGPTGYESRWICGKAKYEEMVKNNLIEWRKVNGNWQVYQKFYLENRLKQPGNLWNDIEGNKKATIETRQLFDSKKVFDFPKPVDLLKKIIQLSSQEDDDIILDFFAGSATTAHAVMELNASENKKRKFICVQIPEPTTEESEAFKAGYKNIADISKERIKRAASKIGKEFKSKRKVDESTIFGTDIIESPDLGFKVFKLSKSNFKIWDSALEKEPEVIQAKLFEHIQHISPEAEQEAILYELLLKSGFELTTPIEKLTLAGLTVFSIAEGQLLICLEKELTHDCIKAMAEMQPTRVICLDEGFKGENADALKTNAVQIMKSKGVVNFRTV